MFTEEDEQYLKRFIVLFLVSFYIVFLTVGMYGTVELTAYIFTIFLCVTALSLLQQLYKKQKENRK